MNAEKQRTERGDTVVAVAVAVSSRKVMNIRVLFIAAVNSDQITSLFSFLIVDKFTALVQVIAACDGKQKDLTSLV